MLIFKSQLSISMITPNIKKLRKIKRSCFVSNILCVCSK